MSPHWDTRLPLPFFLSVSWLQIYRTPLCRIWWESQWASQPLLLFISLCSRASAPFSARDFPVTALPPLFHLGWQEAPPPFPRNVSSLLPCTQPPLTFSENALKPLPPLPQSFSNSEVDWSICLWIPKSLCFCTLVFLQFSCHTSSPPSTPLNIFQLQRETQLQYSGCLAVSSPRVRPLEPQLERVLQSVRQWASSLWSRTQSASLI